MMIFYFCNTGGIFMKDEIKLEWFGHSAYKVEYKGYSVFIDPYADGMVPGLSILKEKANLVLCSHEHQDHGYREAIEITETSIENPFEISFIECSHDDEGGTKRGMNKIHVLKADGINLCHLGDIGDMLTPEQIEKIEGVTVLMAPVGGFYTIDPEKLNTLVNKINPKILVPMHYRNEEFGFDVIGTLGDYLKYCKNIIEYDTNTIYINDNPKEQTSILKYMKK